MPPSTPTLELSRVAEMTWRVWAMFSCTSTEAASHGRDWRPPPRSRSTRRSVRRRCPRLWRCCARWIDLALNDINILNLLFARVSPPSSPCIWTTAEVWGSRRRRTTCTSDSSSGSSSAPSTTSTTTPSTGPCWSRRLLPVLPWGEHQPQWLLLQCLDLAKQCSR